MNTDTNPVEDLTPDTAREQLIEAGDRLADIYDARDGHLASFHHLIAHHIDHGSASVNDMARAAKVERNYIDQVRVRAKLPKLRDMGVSDYPEPARSKALEELAAAADLYRASKNLAKQALAERNALVVRVYRSGLLGPTAIAKAIEVDRNHVMRVQRAAPGAVSRARVKGRKVKPVQHSV